jgi:hypothetical protein
MLDLLVFFYFSIKNYIIYDRFKLFKQNRYVILSSIAVGIGSFLLNYFITKSYKFNLELSFIKGAIELPPFGILLILADVISTVFVILALRSNKIELLSFPKFAFEAARLVILYTVFTSLTIFFWQKSVENKLLNTDYICFKYKLANDLATYYCDNGKFPERLDQATTILVNPINNSKLVSDQGESTISYAVKDQMNNVIVEGHKDFIGISSCSSENKDYLKSIQIILDSYPCQ